MGGTAATTATTAATAATTAAAEEFPNISHPHPITHRDEISRSGNPSLRFLKNVYIPSRWHNSRGVLNFLKTVTVEIDLYRNGLGDEIGFMVEICKK